MPRDGSGNVTLPAGNPVVADTDITASWANVTLADIASMIQGSLSRTGAGGMLGPFKAYTDSVYGPGFTWESDQNTGLYHPAADQIAITLGAAQNALFAAALITLKTALKVEGAAQITGKATLDGDLAVAGNTNLTGNLDIGGTINVAGQFTRASLPTVGQQTSGTSGTWTEAGATDVQVTNFSLALTTMGRPVVIMVIPYNDVGGSCGIAGLTADSRAHLTLRRGATDISAANFLAAAGTNASVPTMLFFDVPAAGTYTYKLLGATDFGDGSVHCTNMKMIVYEL
jgi:hypothetical protein